jgi:glycosyltransferase involved in cell wall biosynthesis
VHIGIDARELCGKPTGVGRYLASLMTAWDRLPDTAGHRFVLYRPAGATLVPGLRMSRLRVEERVVPAGTEAGATTLAGTEAGATGQVTAGATGQVTAGPTISAGTVWEQVHLASALRRDRPDVLFSPAYTAPLATSVPVVLTVHDLSFVAHPEWFPVTTAWRQRLLTTLAARRARRVLTDSEFSRGEIVSRLRIPASRVSVVPLGLTGPPGRARPASSAAHDPMVLFVGSVFNRRHLPELIRAVASISARCPGIRLEVVGDNRTYPHQDLAALSREAGLGPNIGIHSFVSDQALADLYARADLFVFLSDYEGFGLTPLEALASGLPVLVGDTPVAREVYGDAALYVGTTDEAAIAAAIERLIFEPGTRDILLSKAPGILQRYSWENAGRQTLAALLAAPSAVLP